MLNCAPIITRITKPRTRLRYLGALLVTVCVALHSASSSPRLTIGRQGQLILDGAGTIPFGFYHISWIPDAAGRTRLDRELVHDIRTIGSYGFSLIQFNITQHYSAAASLSATLPFHLPVIGELQHGWWRPGTAQQNAFAALGATQNHPSLVAWNIGDDSNWRDAARNLPIEPAALRARRELIKSRAPNQLTYASGVALDAQHDRAIRPMRDYRNTADILGFTSYTLGDESGIPLEYALEQTVLNYRALEEAFADTDQALFAIPQLFRFQGNPEPTITEVRNGVYAALMHGVDGILGYAFYTEHSSVRVLLSETNPPLLRELSNLAREVRLLERYLLSGLRQHLSLTTPSFHGTTWENSTGDLTVIISTDRTHEGRIPLPFQTNKGELVELIPDDRLGFREQTLPVDTANLHNNHLTFKPGQVRIFRTNVSSDKSDSRNRQRTAER